MKIALMTIWNERNFGAEIQCYATVKALKKLGHEVEVINYRLHDFPHSTIKFKIIRALTALSPETKNFKRFWNKNIPFGRFYDSSTKLKESPPIADMYLAGSDQIWNLDITKHKWRTYFLDFGNESIRRCSYASSFGEDDWCWPEQYREANFLLKRFEKIAVREETGNKILENRFNIESKTVLDPTLLHKDYQEIVTTSEQKPILAYYPLVDNDRLEKLSKTIADLLNLQWSNINKRIKLFGKLTWYRTSIEQWISTISTATLIVTPSFHGLAFSLIYHRQFIIIQPESKKNRSSRITGLLNKLDLSDRYFTSIEEVWRSRIWEKQINYKIVDEKLKVLRDDSWKYLKELTQEG